jgi:SAM-dependent methyltransferase
MYIRKRLLRLRPGRFVDAGAGEGLLSRLLLDLGWTGSGWDLNEHAVEQARELTAPYLGDGRYELHHGDWLAAEPSGAADLVVSSMLLEHLDDDGQGRYFDRAAAELATGGQVILLVPGSPRHWGIEDEVVGHLRRYTRESLRRLIEEAGWEVQHLVGLNWPLSNLLLGVSNKLVHGAESHRLTLDREHRSIESGLRHVPWKTRFPNVMRLALNEWTMRPFHIAQLAGLRSANALVLYCECRIAGSESEAGTRGGTPPRSEAVSAPTTRKA